MNTKKTYSSHLKAYMIFCNKLKVKPVPASQETIAQYAAYLARTHRPASVKQYLNIIRLLHLEAGFDNPLADSWIIKSTLKGIERCLGGSVSRKKPVDPQLLLKVYGQLDLSNPLDVMFYAAALTMFFGTLRRSNLMPKTSGEFSSDKQFVRSDFQDTPFGIRVTVRWSKTIQCRERAYEINFPTLSGNCPLCPCTALRRAFKLVRLPMDSPAFVSDSSGIPLTAGTFDKKLKKVINQCGVDSARYSLHSFRRGSACWALQCGIPGEIIQQMGDWKSAAYKDYLDEIPESHKLDYMAMFSDKLPSC